MFSNYVKIAFRNLIRNKLFSFINIIGLAIGLAACALILLFVRDEFGWDDHWERAEDIYRLETTLQHPVSTDRLSPYAPDPMKDILLDSVPEVEAVTRYMEGGMSIMRDGAVMLQEGLLADPNFFEFFDFEFLAGDPDTAFNSMNSVVISERSALSLYGDQAALGRTVTIRIGGEFRDFTVSAVITDPVVDTHIDHDFILPFNREYFVGSRWFTEDWRFLYRNVFVKFAPGTNVDSVRAALPGLVEQHRPKPEDEAGQENARTVILHLVALTDAHLYSHASTSDPDVLMGFVGLAALILLIAVANFLNLSMARTSNRAREVAMRKVVGASRKQIVEQFLGEATALALIAMTVAFVLVEVSLPYYNEFLSAVVAFDFFAGPGIAVGGLMLVITVGLVAGSFQATYFALLKPRDVLYSNMSSDHSTGRLRSVLVVAQFTISIALMVGAFFVNKQTNFARTLDLGFNPENLIVVAGTNSDQSNALKTRLLASDHIVSVGRSSDVPTRGSEDRLTMRQLGTEELVTLDGLPTDADFFSVFEIPLIAGRYLTDTEADYLRQRAGDGEYRERANIVVNKSGAELLGFKDPAAAIGQTVPTNLTATQYLEATIVGVVDDFHFDSARDVIRPGIYYLDERRLAEMTVRLSRFNREAAIADLEAVWRDMFPDQVLFYSYMGDLVEEQYQTEDQLSTALMAFTLLAVTISCLGLYGLASFAVDRRTKEIGIRRVLGASFTDVAVMLIWQFSKPIVIALLVALPIAVYMVNDWLSGFAYRIDMEAAPFVMVALTAVAIGWATVAGHAFKVARANPVKALRYE
ncbi:MAG: ABC transporter permease [Kordiimonadaceae bacterium]|nr:ABC transporter permease [Kordiimonadaceae bacterium]MBO6568237.1 ABC transporter permease [Kordiimonadaceae bacterium]MBO6964033.1 ABC transporter permease [Kordiimonadaceae bacterium]